MPNTDQAKKAKRQQDRRRRENNRVKKQMKSAEKDFEVAVNDSEKGEEDIPVRHYQEKVDEATKKNIIHKNKAARMKSKMMKDLKERKDFENEDKS